MTFADPKKRSEYQIAYAKKRRDAWFATNGPCTSCGSWDDLQLDHKDRTTKVSHKIWGWSQKRREEELAKCQALCVTCHRGKSSAEISKIVTAAWKDPDYRESQRGKIAQGVLALERTPCPSCGKMFKPAGHGRHRSRCKGT